MASVFTSCRTALLPRSFLLRQPRLIVDCHQRPRRVVRFASTTTQKFDGPLELIHHATQSVKEASDRLLSLQEKIDKPFTIAKGSLQEKEATLRDIVLHSRDADPTDFHHLVAANAREQVMPLAKDIETDLKDFSAHYTETLKPVMDQATLVCRDMPCGGASLEVDKNLAEALSSGQTKGKVEVQGNETPCGKFTTASLDFLQTTYDTKEQMTLGSRCALILRLAHQEFNEPLATAGSNKESKKRMGQVFAEQVVPTPWIRSEEEYQQFFQIKEQIESEK